MCIRDSWGPGRIVPVRLTSFQVEEQFFSPVLFGGLNEDPGKWAYAILIDKCDAVPLLKVADGANAIGIQHLLVLWLLNSDDGC